MMMTGWRSVQCISIKSAEPNILSRYQIRWVRPGPSRRPAQVRDCVKRRKKDVA
jgi:hypothetical protein